MPIPPKLRAAEIQFTGQKLLDLIIAIESAVGAQGAGATPLGKAVIRLCEDTLRTDVEALRLSRLFE